MQANNQDGKVWVTRISFQKSAYLCIMTGVKCLNCMITLMFTRILWEAYYSDGPGLQWGQVPKAMGSSKGLK